MCLPKTEYEIGIIEILRVDAGLDAFLHNFDFLIILMLCCKSVFFRISIGKISILSDFKIRIIFDEFLQKSRKTA